MVRKRLVHGYCTNCGMQADLGIASLVKLDEGRWFDVIYSSCGCVYNLDTGTLLTVDGRLTEFDADHHRLTLKETQ